jgi:pimeloyl-ACP methyl ester carboxylesterase
VAVGSFINRVGTPGWLVLALTVGMPCQVSAEAPYPILLVHGLNSSDQMWHDAGLVGHLSGLGWTLGGTIAFELGHTDTIADVVIASENIVSANGDLWLINFESAPVATSNWAAINLQAEALRQTINRIKTLTSREKVVLLGHSMGGLASSAYIVGDPNGDSVRDFYQDDVAGLTTLGTPFGGAILATLISLFGGHPDYDASNALRDLHNDLAFPNVFLFGGMETDIPSAFFYQDVSCDGHVDDHLIRGINEMVYGADWPTDVSYSWIIGDLDVTNTDCVVACEDQYITGFGRSKVINAAHTSACLGASCTEPRAFDAIVEALDEPDSFLTPYLVDADAAYQGFITRFDVGGVDRDYYRFDVAGGLKRISATLTNPPVANTGLRLLDNNSAELASDSGSSGTLHVSAVVLNDATTDYYVEVSGFAVPSDPGYSDNACNPAVTNCPNCSSAYTFQIGIDVAQSTVSLSADPGTIGVGGETILTADVVDPQGDPVGGGVGVVFETSHPGEFSQCAKGRSVCDAITDINGVAQVRFTSSTVGTATFTASADTGGVDSTSVVIAPSNITANASPNPVEVGMPSTISVSVRDGTGDPPPAGTPVTFATAYPGYFSGNGASSTTSPSTVLTDAAGDTWIWYTSEVPGNANITVESMGQSTIVPIEIVDPSSGINVDVTVGFLYGTETESHYDVAVALTDDAGDPVAYQTVDFDFSPGHVGYWPGPGSCSTGPGGTCSEELVITVEGEVVVTATAGSATGGTTFYAYINPGPPDPLSLKQQFSIGGRVYGVDFSPDGSTLVASNGNGDWVFAWNTSDWSTKWSTATSDNDADQVSVSPGGIYFMVATDDGGEVRRLTDGGLHCAGSISDSSGAILGAWTSPSSYVTTSFDHVFRHSSMCASGSLIADQPASGDGLERRSHVDYSPDRGWFAVGTDEGTVYVWTASGTEVTTRTVSPNTNAHDVDFNGDGSELAAVGWNAVKVFNTSTWSSTSISAPHLGDQKYSVAFIDNDSKLAIGAHSRIEVVNMSDGSSVATADVSGRALEMAWNPSSNELAVGTDSGYVYVFGECDSNPPLISVTVPSDGQVTDETPLTTTGLVTDETEIVVFTINGVVVSLDGSGNFSHDVDLVEGANTLTYFAEDSCGNDETVTRTVTLVVDRTPPVISSVQVIPTSGLPGTNYQIEATVVDGDTGVGSVTATVNLPGGGSTACAMGHVGGDVYSCSYDSAGQAAGAYVVDIEAVDSSPQQNTGTATSAAVFYVCIEPAAPMLDAPAQWPSNSSYDVTWTATSGDNTYEIQEATDPGFSSPSTLFPTGTSQSYSHSSGTYYYRVRALELCGGSTFSSTWSNTGTVTISDALIFADGFETGDTANWSETTGGR